MNFFKTKPRTPPELVRGLRDAIPRMEQGPPGSETRRRAHEEVQKNLQAIKSVLVGDGGVLSSLLLLPILSSTIHPSMFYTQLYPPRSRMGNEG
jgi:hypothetical protein